MESKPVRKRFQLLPAYSWLPLILCLVINVLSFQGTRLFTRGWYHYDISLPIDKLIPLRAEWVLIYVGCYFSWAASYWLIAREDMERSHRFFSAEIVGKLFCTAFFIFMPTIMVRPELQGDDLCTSLLRIVYASDTPDNLFPSLHCFASWMSWRGLVGCKKVPSWYRVFCFVLMFLVFASVLFTRQHLVLDIFGGIACAELGYLVSNATGAWRLFGRKKQAAAEA
ncbi:MAG: phosphatidic acid phosphatase [Ruminococcaceae bacterium]|nr:phosphatidic acid phosphatase [Oscillospiraceae bacterium]